MVNAHLPLLLVPATFLLGLFWYYLECHDRIPPRRHVPRVEVPVNMRRVHPSETMRHQLEVRQLGRQISRNVAGEQNPVVRVIPLFLKDRYRGTLCYTPLDRIFHL